MNRLYFFLPYFFQNILISLYNFNSYRKRYGGNYKKYLKIFKENERLTLDELYAIQSIKYSNFIKYVKLKSKYFNSILNNTSDSDKIVNINKLPILNKEELRKNINEINSIKKDKGIISKTGGTTGKSLEVIFTYENMHERFAMLDNFRNQSGYNLGKKTAWFSGKNLIDKRDILKKRFWKMDYLHRVRYYSTFHVKNDYLKYYIEDLINFKPEYLVGFPSTIHEIAKFGIINEYCFPSGIVKAVFPTAETITFEMKQDIEFFFQTKMFNQYASSEGAPFIFECKNGNLHLELQSGIFEVLDENNYPSNTGRLIITSFTTYGTPLIRYDIGDYITLESNEKKCNCGNNNPLVNEINGRIDDFIYSSDNGKINLGNVSNTLKSVKGIIKFQAIQNEISKIEILIVIDSKDYNVNSENQFLKNWRERVGNNMRIELKIVEDIPVEKSGKFRIVKNNIKHLL